MISRLVKTISAILVVAQVLDLAFLAPGSLGRNETTLDGLRATLFILTFCNGFVAIVVTLVGTRGQGPVRMRGQPGYPSDEARYSADVQFDMSVRLSELLSRPAKVALLVVLAAGVTAATYGVAAIPSDKSAQAHGHDYYRLSHGKRVQITHADYVAALHPGLVFQAGITTALQVAAFCVTLLAIDRLSSRARGITDWPALEDDADPKSGGRTTNGRKGRVARKRRGFSA